MSDKSLLVLDAVVKFLNDRKGFHVDDLDEEIQEEFKTDLRKEIAKALKEAE